MTDITQACLLQSNFHPTEQREMWGSDELDYDDLVRALDADDLKLEVRRRRKIQTELARARATRRITERGERWDGDFERALNAEMVRDLRDDAGDISIEALSHSIVAETSADLAEVAETLRVRRAGFKRQYEITDRIVRRLFGEETGDAIADRMGDSIARALEGLRQRFNDAGGNIRKRVDWSLPQTHNAQVLIKAGFDTWSGKVRPLLDRQKMTTTWGRPLRDDELQQALRSTYNAITSEGVTEQQELAGRTAVANRHREHRELHFKDAESYLAYQKDFGEPNTWKTITDHIERLSREIALIERWGPNPDSTFEQLSAMTKASQRKQTALDMVSLDPKRIYDNLRGFDKPENSTLARVGGTARLVTSSAQLGSILLASLSDPVVAGLNAKMNGMQVMRMLKRVKTDPNSRQLATQLGAGIDNAMDSVGAAARYDDVVGNRFMKAVSDINFRLGLVNAWMNGFKEAHYMEMMVTLAENQAKAYDDLPPGLRKMLGSYGIEPGEWAFIQRGTTVTHKGEHFMDPLSIDNPEVLSKLVGAAHTERRVGVLEPDARVQATINRGHAPGTGEGEVLRAFWQYKNFSVAVLMHGVGRYIFTKRLTKASRAGYVTALFTGMTMMGAVSVQLKEIAKGREPRDMDSPDFWKAAAMQGGGLGILGDFFFAPENRYRKGPIETVGGPTAGMAVDIGRMAADIATGEPGDAFDTASRYLPYQSLFYSRLLVDRLMRDTLGSAMDPEWEMEKRKYMRKRKTQHGQDFWWRHNELTPE